MERIQVVFHSGEVEVIESDDHDPVAFEKRWNSHDVFALRIGNQLFSRIDLKWVKPLKDGEEPAQSTDQATLYEMSLKAQREQAQVWRDAKNN